MTTSTRPDTGSVGRREARNFAKLWASLSISLTGSEVTTLALPLIAAVTLQASAWQMGVLAAIGQLPHLICSLPAGELVDRVRRRPLLVLSDLGSAAVLLSLPASIPFGGPTFAHLCVAAFGVGTFYLLSNVAHYAYVPTLVDRANLTKYNARLQISHSASEAAGPGLAGLIIQVLSAPIAVLVDAVSFLFSAALLGAIRHDEPTPARSEEEGRDSPLAGIRLVLRHPLLRPIVLTGPIWVFFESAALAIYVLYAVRNLHLSAGVIGLVAAAGGLGALPGAALAGWAGRRFGVGPTIIVGWFLAASTMLAVPLASGPLVLIALVLAMAKALGGLVGTVANVHQWTLRQAVTPDDVGGRVTAAARFLVYGSGSIGGLFGGLLGDLVGLRTTLVVCALGCMVAPVCELLSPIRGLREQPT